MGLTPMLDQSLYISMIWSYFLVTRRRQRSHYFPITKFRFSINLFKRANCSILRNKSPEKNVSGNEKTDEWLKMYFSPWSHDEISCCDVFSPHTHMKLWVTFVRNHYNFFNCATKFFVYDESLEQQ